MDAMTQATESLSKTAMDTARAAYWRALRDARDAVARLTDGDSPAHDSAIAEACDAIEALQLPPELRVTEPECVHSFVAPQGTDGRSYLNRRVCRHCGLHRKLEGNRWVDTDAPAQQERGK